MTHSIDDGYSGLAAAMLLQAIKDVRRGDSTAAYWLMTTGADWYEFSTGENLDLDFWKAWVQAGCPEAETRKNSKKRMGNEQRSAQCVDFKKIAVSKRAWRSTVSVD